MDGVKNRILKNKSVPLLKSGFPVGILTICPISDLCEICLPFTQSRPVLRGWDITFSENVL